MIERKDQLVENTWDISLLAKNAEEWDKELEQAKAKFPEVENLKGTLGKSSDSLYNALCTIRDLLIQLEKLGSWAFLNYSADSMNADVQRRAGIFSAVESELGEKMSFFDPELLEIEDEKIEEYLKEDRYEEFRVYIRKARRFKDHILSEKEEKLLSLYAPVQNTHQETFQDLNNIDLSFGEINGESLSHGNYSKYMHSDDEGLRERAYRQYYKEFNDHRHTIARSYSGSIKNDIFISKARGYASSLEKALFPDNMPKSVYTSLIESIHEAFPHLHRYYKLRAKLLGKEKLKHWDVYVPMVKSVKSKHTYDEAVALINEAVKPLGDEYRTTLVNGLAKDRWVDRYENKGKRSGAFSAGCFTGNPYILVNFEEEVLNSVYTLIHEGGHSMHSYYSSRNNPFMCYDYTIFEAEVASTFNEELLQDYLVKNAKSPEEEAYLIAKHLDDMVGTLFRQTMFAEFELLVHEAAEKGIPTTIDFFKKTYRSLLEAYFGDTLEFIEESDLEGLRIPHFYRAFYCYKYATGLSASIALSQKVLNGDEKDKQDYLSFLKSGGSVYPLESLKKAGVDMSTPEPVKAATALFARELDRLEELTK